MAVRKKNIAQSRKMQKPTSRKTTASKMRTAQKMRAQRSTKSKEAGNLSSFPSSPITQKQSKAQIFNELAELTGLKRADVKSVIAALKNLLERNLKGKGFGEFILPELGIKVRRIHKAATKARLGRNPFTGEEIKIPAKPARKTVKATALKKLKEIVLN